MKKRITFIISIIIILSSTISFADSVYEVDKQPIRIAIIDTGISSTAISDENIIEGKNYILPNNSTEDGIGHGTAVAGIIVGSKIAGVDGLCPTAQLVPLVYYSKFDDDRAVKGNLPMLAQAIRDAVDIYNCDIINISSGARVDTPALRDAIAWAEKKGVIVVSSAGNDGNNNIYYPSAFPTVISVGSINKEKSGGAIFSNRHEGVNLLAPGINIPTLNINGEIVNVSGTSFSTAIVTGVVANILSEYPALTPYEIRNILYTTADDIGSKGYDIETGWGLVNLDKVLDKLSTKEEKETPFIDVNIDSYYRETVNWALRNGITSGTTSSTFSPDMTCTRAETLTFIWRAMGCPEPRIIKNPFHDVKETDYFYKAVLSAVEKGITSGTTDNTFSPSNTCNDAEVITFIWRAKNSPNAAGASMIAAKLGEYYYTDAVAWADTHGLFSDTQIGFIPMREANRAQIVTYLYKSISSK